MNTYHLLKQSGNYSVDQDIVIDNPAGNSIRLTIDITNNNLGGGAGALTVTIYAFDKASGKKTTLLASASLATIGTAVLQVGPGLPVTTNVSDNKPVPRRIGVILDHTNANPMTYSVGADLIV